MPNIQKNVMSHKPSILCDKGEEGQKQFIVIPFATFNAHKSRVFAETEDPELLGDGSVVAIQIAHGVLDAAQHELQEGRLIKARREVRR